jgi:hypothetical protein
VGQLLQLVEGALARTRVHQLASLNDARTPNDPAGSAPAWSIEIPIPSASGFDSLRLRLEEQPWRRGETAREAREWSVMLCLAKALFVQPERPSGDSRKLCARRVSR